MRTFYTWLIVQSYRKDPVGDLAQDILQDNELPYKKTKKTLYNHILNCGACYECELAFEQAWSEYKLFRKKLK